MTQKPYKLSLASAILININIMLGSGIFINTVLLSQKAGILGASVYGIVALLILPLIIIMAQLLRYFPQGTLYDFGASIHPLVGFLSSWGYFTGKLATSALGIHVFVTINQQLIPALAHIPTYILNYAILCAFLGFNMLDLKIGRSIQYGFLIVKSLPIFFVILSALFLYTGEYNSATHNYLWAGIPACIPFVLFAFSGFEASASLSSSIENSERNAPLAILISYCLVLAITVIYQFGFFNLIGESSTALDNFRQAYPLLTQMVLTNYPFLQKLATSILMAGIASSTLGASYGILYSNIWNLQTLARNNHLPGKKYLTALNYNNVPYYCVLVEGIFVIGYFIYAQGNQIPLQQISACGATIAYTISACACLYASKKKSTFFYSISLASLASCLLLLSATIHNAYSFGIHAYLLYSIILITGILLFFIKKLTK